MENACFVCLKPAEELRNLRFSLPSEGSDAVVPLGEEGSFFPFGLFIR